MPLQSINPATGELISEYHEMSVPEWEKVLSQVQIDFEQWRRTDFTIRSKKMHRAADVLRENKQPLGELITNEMGKPLTEAMAEVEKCAWVCDYYADKAATFLAAEDVSTEMYRSYVAFQPLGIVLAIMPWNFPFWQVFRFAAPGLMAGNGAVLKHSSNVSGCALAIEEIFREAGFPVNLFRTLLIGSGQVRAVIDHSLVKAVTLTGSTPAGKAVAARAGSTLKKTVLELGGSDPYIILADADLEAAVEACVFARLLNCGQSCIAAKRFIVVADVADRFEELVLEKMRAKSMGDPMMKVDLGPMARSDLRDELHQQVTRSVESGAVLLLGGKIPSGPGAYYPPTVLTCVTPGMPAFDEELFGPVAAIIRAGDEAEAIALANKSDFGLGAAVFTCDVEKGQRIAEQELEAGCCFVNDFVRSDPRLPFGGVKMSGYGRELAQFGIREFVNIKTVCIK
ncbi:MAG: NAD-dependent succinate-semialdehyde dehydrogenase [Candidatus Marinimicrobia bacterium]|nr:NAD-dependent succinate-semialdehyde dehydrogenase [Candidatus Neomarinimicrobiota bacterium]